MEKNWYEIFAVERYVNIGKFDDPRWIRDEDTFFESNIDARNYVGSIYDGNSDYEFMKINRSIAYVDSDRELMMIIRPVKVFCEEERYRNKNEKEVL